MNDLLTRTFSRRGRDVEDGRGGGGVEMQSVDTQSYLAGFFEEVGVIKKEMERVRELLDKLHDANEESKTIHKPQAVKALRDRMDQDVATVSKTAMSIKDKLERLDNANAASRKVKGCEENSPTDRSRTMVTNGLRKSLKDSMDGFASFRSKMVEEYRDTIDRRYQMITGEKPDEETLETMIETGESETFLQKAVQEQGRGQVLESIREIQERHDGVKDIERSLLELHQIFMDMAVLVEAQGEQVNDIEAQVIRAHSYVSRGVTQLQQAKRHQRSTRKWTCIGIILLLIVIAAVVIPIVVTLKN